MQSDRGHQKSVAAWPERGKAGQPTSSGVTGHDSRHDGQEYEGHVSIVIGKPGSGPAATPRMSWVPRMGMAGA